MRRALSGLLVCAALLASGAGPAQAKPMHDVPYEPLPTSFDELPAGAPTALPWWQDGVLHVAGNEITTPFRLINHRAGTTVVGKGSGYPGSRTEWYLVVRKKLKPLMTKGTAHLPTISANGRWIVWLKETELSAPVGELGGTDTRHDLVVYDAKKRKVKDVYTNRRTVYDDGVNGMGLSGVSNRGWVHLGINGADFIWRPGHQPVKLKGRNYDNYLDLDSWPRGITQFARIQDAGLYGTADKKGRFEKQGLVPRWGTWSAGGEAYAYRTDGGSSWVDRIDDGLRVQLGVPDVDDDNIGLVGWESDTDVVVWWHDTYGEPKVSQLARCDTVTGDCERVADGPDSDTPAEMQTRS